MVREDPARPPPQAEQEPYPAEKARGGEIILDTPLKRWIFSAVLSVRWCSRSRSLSCIEGQSRNALPEAPMNSLSSLT